MKETFVEFTAVSKQYDRRNAFALRGLSFSVRAGEIFGLIGLNGAGKTTTLKLAAGILVPDAGSICIGGFDLRREPGLAKKDLAYTAADPLVYERMTGYQFLSFIARIYKMPKKDALSRMESLIKEFDLREAMGERIASWPFGLKQKISLVAAFLHEPKILVLDEPFAGLDPDTVSLVVGKLKSCARSGVAVVLATYFLEVAEKLCHRIGILRRGELVACDRLAALKRNCAAPRASLANVFKEFSR